MCHLPFRYDLACCCIFLSCVVQLRQSLRNPGTFKTDSMLLQSIISLGAPECMIHKNECCDSMQALGSWLSAYTQMGVKAYQSEHGSRQPTAERVPGLLTSHEAAGRTTHHSNALFSWLFRACLAYQLYEWLRVKTPAHNFDYTQLILRLGLEQSLPGCISSLHAL